jgi:acetylornithine/succinyldiaminopimelate/putrescine aminotransferase
LKILDVIQREKLADNARQVGGYFKTGLQALAQKYPNVIQAVRGLGLMVGLELAPNIPNFPGDSSKTQAIRFANLLHAAGLLAIPAGAQIMRFLPPLNLRQSEAEEGLKLIESVVARLH